VALVGATEVLVEDEPLVTVSVAVPLDAAWVVSPS
jgi:hypothetical protein